MQKTRVLARPGMTEEKLENIRKQQMSDFEKRQRATFIIPTGNGRRSTLQAVAQSVKLLRDGLLPAPTRR